MATATATRKRKNGRNGAEVGVVEARLNSVRADLDALQQDVRGLVSDVGGMASDQVSGAVNGALETAYDTVDRVGEWSNGNLNEVRRAVRTQPLAACMISMSAGALIGALLLR
jgi:ElaB/YqjD/DUF883 family membrane-anchored ribosome-binding protein